MIIVNQPMSEGSAIGVLWWFDYKRNKDSIRLAGFVFLAVLFQMIWVVALIMTEGSLTGFFKLRINFFT
jgi:hypothetical protein